MKNILIILICAICFISGCGETTKSETGSVPSKDDGVVLVNGYENQTDLNTLMMFNYLGKVELNSEKKYVSSGASSIKITVQSDKTQGAVKTGFIFQSFFSAAKGFDERDFENKESVSFKMYNPCAETVRIGFRLVFTRGYHLGNNNTDIRWFSLTPNSWTECVYNVNPSIMNRTESDDGDGIVKGTCFVAGSDFLFYIPSANESDEIFYMDDVKITKKQ